AGSLSSEPNRKIGPIPIPRIRHETSPGGRMVIRVRQSAEYEEPTTVGISFHEGDGYPLRVPIGPGAESANGSIPNVRVTAAGNGEYVIHIQTASEPANVSIDPDRVLLDKNPGNNTWKTPPRLSISPLYTMLNETDLTNDYDRWNIGGGPWIGGALYPDPWFTRSTMAGVRAAAYRTQVFAGGAYAAVRSDYRDAIIGVDAFWDHAPLPRMQTGALYEERIGGPWGDVDGRDLARRGAVFSRYVFQYGSSLYLPPIHYLEGFSTYSDNFLPVARGNPGGIRPNYTWLSGLHWRLNLYTPYWDPECGFWLDASYAAGTAGLGYDAGHHRVRAEAAAVHKLPAQLPWLLSESRLAVRVVGVGNLPNRGLFESLGGG
ncbi:MAG: hypothetical protein ACRCZF_19425, partial [Gemmataceae bacterium]